MLPTLRSIVLATVILVIAVLTISRGLLPSPDAVTRIGTVPMVGRNFVQMSIVPQDETQRRLHEAAVRSFAQAEATTTAPVAAPEAGPAGIVAKPAIVDTTASGETHGGAPSPLPLVAADDRAGATAAAARARSDDPLGDLIRAVLPETAVPTPPATVAALPNAVPDVAAPPSAEPPVIVLPTTVPTADRAATPATRDPRTVRTAKAVAAPRVVRPVRRDVRQVVSRTTQPFGMTTAGKASAAGKAAPGVAATGLGQPLPPSEPTIHPYPVY